MMKRLLFLMVSCVILFAQCEHPYEEDLIGSFPFADMLDKSPEIFTSDASECVLRVSTNMVISTKTTYVEGGSVNWLTIESAEEKGGIVRLTLKIDGNIRRENRKAEVTVYADGTTVVDVVPISQKAYVVDGKENVCEGDLVLKTQDEIDNCIYTRVNGNLIIGGYTGDIRDLSPLEVITAVSGNVKIFGCDVKDMGPLGGLDVKSVEFDSVNPALISTWRGSVKEVTVRNIGSGNVSLSYFTEAEKMVLSDNLCTFSGYEGLKKVKVAEMKFNEFTDTEGMEEMTSLASLYLSDNPLVNVNSLANLKNVKKIDLSRTELSKTQINYLREMLPSETEIVSEDLSGKATMALTNVETKYFNATFEGAYRNFTSTLSQYGYVLLKADEKFTTDYIVSLDRNVTDSTFEIEGLESDTEYHIWLYAVDRNGAVNISESVRFTTMEVIEVYEGDLVLDTQEKIYDCVHKEVKGNLTIGMTGSDINDLSTLSIESVSGGVTIKGCHNLTGFGVVANYRAKYIELDDVSYNLAARWTGEVEELRIRNIKTGIVNVGEFDEVTSLTLQNNSCEFTGITYLRSVTDAVLSENQFTTAEDFKNMTLLKTIDLSKNPLVNINSLADMTSLEKVNLSETKLSATQVNYLESCLPDALVVGDDLKGTATLTVREETIKYSSAKLTVEYSGISNVSQSGYILNKTGEFSRTGWQTYYFSSNLESFDIKGLEDDTDYYIWVYIQDNVGSLHLSEPLKFTTQKIVYNYIGDLVLETQDDVDECVHTSVQGSLTVGGEESDISDLSSLPIAAITGNLTIKGCPNLTSFGTLKNLNVPHVIMDNVAQSILDTWEGTAEELTVRNIKTSSICDLADFDEVTKLTITDNKCQFSGLNKLVNVTEANLSRNRFSTISNLAAMTRLKTLDLSGNPLSNLNPLAGMTGLTNINLSDTPLSSTQIRYLVASLPETVTVKADDITGTAELGVTCVVSKYYSATFNTTKANISSNSNVCGYYLSKSSVFPGESGRKQTDVSGSFVVSDLTDGTEYYLWTYFEDNNRSIHLSEPVVFTTKTVVDNYVGDLVLATQTEVDECVNVKIQGDLTIGCDNSDITNLWDLTITSVTGKLTVKGCSGLADFGSLRNANVTHLALHSVHSSLTKTWCGTTSELTITGIQDLGDCTLSTFEDITTLTLNSNACQFTGIDSLSRVTYADLSSCCFNDASDLKGMGALKTLSLSGNPLVNINALAQMDGLTSLDLSNTPLSMAQVRYVLNSLPASVSVKYSDIEGTSSLGVTLDNVKYYTATFNTSFSGISGVSSGNSGYYINTEATFPGEDGKIVKDITSGTFEVKGLDDDTKYYIWIYMVDNQGSIYLSEPVEFTTNKVIETYVGDITLKTQAEVDNCYNKKIDGNLTIDTEGGDISDISQLRITSVTGKLTVKGSNLDDLGPVGKITVPHVHLESVNPSVANTWAGSTSALTVTDVQSSSNFDLSKFDEVTSLTLNSNTCQFIGFDALVNVTEADLSDCSFTDVECLKGMTSLRTLNLSGNPLTNINALAKMTWLTSITLDDTPLSQSQVRFLINSLPASVAINSNGITGNSDLSVSLNNVKYFTASMTATISGINGVASNTSGYYLNTSSVFPGIQGRQQTDIVSGAFEVTGLEDGAKYWLWVYAADSAGSIHLSEPIVIETEEINDYMFTMNPVWPKFANDDTIANEFTGVHSNVFIRQESKVSEKIGNMTASGSNYSINLPEGELSMGFVAVEGIPERDSFDGYTWNFNNKDAISEWNLEIESENGCHSDIALAILEYEFEEDAAVNVDFVRPVAKVDITVDLTGSVGNLSNIDNISISMKNHYAVCKFTEGSSVYNEYLNHVFSKKITEIPADRKFKIADGRYVFPLAYGYNRDLSVTLTFKNGTTKTVSPSFSTDIQANNAYDFTFDIVLIDGSGSFTVDVIERVEDNIEF